MKQAPNERNIENFFRSFYDQNQKLIGFVADLLGIAAGAAWLIGIVSPLPAWFWPIASALALVALGLALYRNAQLSNDLAECKKAFNGLIRTTLAGHVETIKGALIDAKESGSLPITRLASVFTALRQFDSEPEKIDELIDLIEEYENLRVAQGK